MKSPHGSARDIRHGRQLTIWVPIGLLIGALIAAAISGCGTAKLSPTAAQAAAGAGNPQPSMVAGPVHATIPAHPAATPTPTSNGWNAACKPPAPAGEYVSVPGQVTVVWALVDVADQGSDMIDPNPTITRGQTAMFTWDYSPYVRATVTDYSVDVPGFGCVIRHFMTNATTTHSFGNGLYMHSLSFTAKAGTVAWVMIRVEQSFPVTV